MAELLELSKKQLEALLRKYFVDHSSRRLNFLYWNISELKDQLLNFVNLSGKDLNRINNSDLVYRLIKVKNQQDWVLLSTFINNYIVDMNNKRGVYIIRIDYLFGYLKSIEYNLDNFELTREDFGVGYCHNDDLAKRKPICATDEDIQSLYLMNRVLTKYRQFIGSVPDDVIVSDITDSYVNDPNFKFDIITNDTRVLLPTTDALDIVSRKFICGCKETNKLEQIFISNGLSTVLSKFTCTDMVIISVRVYIQLFLKKYNKKRKKNHE